MERGQGAIEYLLLIAAAILVVSIVIIAITAVTQEGTTTVDSDNVTNITKELGCMSDLNYLGQDGGIYQCCLEADFNANLDGC